MIKESVEKNEDETEKQVERKKERKKQRNTEIMKTSYKSVEDTRCQFRSLLWWARRTALNHAETRRKCVM